MADSSGAMSLQDRELAQLLQRVARSDQRAFKRLYDLASPVIFGVLTRMFTDKSAAEDALQETFVKIWIGADSYLESQGKPLTWMTSIARYHALDVIRSQTATVKRELEYSFQQSLTGDILQNVDAQRSDGQMLSLCLERLEPNARECVVHAFCGGYTHQELSEVTGKALGTIKSWIRRSLKALRECVDELS